MKEPSEAPPCFESATTGLEGEHVEVKLAVGFL